MEEKNGYLYIWWEIDDNESEYYCTNYTYMGCVMYKGNPALKFKI